MNAPNYASNNEETTFVKYHKALRDTLNKADMHFTICKYLRELRSTHLDELNVAPAFFGLTIEAHLLAALMNLNKFFDKREQHLSIRNFLDFIEQNLNIFSSEAFQARMRSKGRYESYIIKEHSEITLQKVEEDRRKVENLPAGSIRKWRTEILAHIGVQTVLQDVDIRKEYRVETEHIDYIIGELHDMLNDYSLAYESSQWVKGLPIKYGIKAVVDAIRFQITETRR